MLNLVIAFVGTKGGILKSTLCQCLSTASPFDNFKVGILDADPQQSIVSWHDEREDSSPTLSVDIHSLKSKKNLAQEVEHYQKQYDFLFVDLPGESEALNLTNTMLGMADLVIIPIRTYHKDIQAFDYKLSPYIEASAKLRGTFPFRILCTFAHVNTNIEKYRQHFEGIDFVGGVFDNVHKDRSVYTYFSIGGLTIKEYLDASGSDKIEKAKAEKAYDEMNAIADEICKLLI